MCRVCVNSFFHLELEFDRWKLRKLKPVAAVGDPPADDADGDGGQQTPQQGQSEIGNQTQRDEDGPKDLPLHFFILTRRRAYAGSQEVLVRTVQRAFKNIGARAYLDQHGPVSLTRTEQIRAARQRLLAFCSLFDPRFWQAHCCRCVRGQFDG